METTIIPSEERPEDKRLKKLKYHKWLPQPFNGTMLCFGSAGSGKSSFIWTFYNEWTRNYFDELVIFCATRDSEDTFKKIKQRNVIVINEYEPNAFQKYLDDLEEEQVERIRKGKFPLRVSILFDDFAGGGITSQSKPTPVDRLALNCRHLNVFLVITSQRFRLLSNTLRQNVHYVVLYRMPRPDIERVGEEFSDPLSPDEFSNIAMRIVSQKYEFMVIDIRAPLEKRFRLGMDNIIPITLTL